MDLPHLGEASPPDATYTIPLPYPASPSPIDLTGHYMVYGELSFDVSKFSADPMNRTVADRACTFADDEIDFLACFLWGVPLCLEHDVSKTIGVVTRAERTESGGIWITAAIDPLATLGRRAISRAKSGGYTALRLGHEFNFGPDNLGVYKTPKEVTLARE
jgi:hypothetical protein